jgi:hypothetical protein
MQTMGAMFRRLSAGGAAQAPQAATIRDAIGEFQAIVVHDNENMMRNGWATVPLGVDDDEQDAYRVFHAAEERLKHLQATIAADKSLFESPEARRALEQQITSAQEIVSDGLGAIEWQEANGQSSDGELVSPVFEGGIFDPEPPLSEPDFAGMSPKQLVRFQRLVSDISEANNPKLAEIVSLNTRQLEEEFQARRESGEHLPASLLSMPSPPVFVLRARSTDFSELSSAREEKENRKRLQEQKSASVSPPPRRKRFDPAQRREEFAEALRLKQERIVANHRKLKEQFMTRYNTIKTNENGDVFEPRITGKTEHELTLENKVDVTWHRQKFDGRDPRKGLDPRTLTHSKKGGHPYHGSDLVHFHF